jgi:hypothetical protein
VLFNGVSVGDQGDQKSGQVANTLQTLDSIGLGGYSELSLTRVTSENRKLFQSYSHEKLSPFAWSGWSSLVRPLILLGSTPTRVWSSLVRVTRAIWSGVNSSISEAHTRTGCLTGL